MTLLLQVARSSNGLWRGFSQGFLGELGSRRGPDNHAAQAWLTHRLQRDRLWKDAADAGLSGWLNPPHAFFSELPRLFDLTERPIGVMERQVLLDRIACEEGERLGFGPAAVRRADRPGLGRAVDQLIGELLPEGTAPDELAVALSAAACSDDFDRTRNAWLVAVYGRYSAELAGRGWYDGRAVHSIVADRIAGGQLSAVLGGAGRPARVRAWSGAMG